MPVSIAHTQTSSERKQNQNNKFTHLFVWKSLRVVVHFEHVAVVGGTPTFLWFGFDLDLQKNNSTIGKQHHGLGRFATPANIMPTKKDNDI